MPQRRKGTNPTTTRARSKRKDDAKSSASDVATKKIKIEDKPSTSKDTSNAKVIQFSGNVPIDEGFPEYVKEPYHVYTEGGLTYNAMLNQSNIGKNNNKYYIIQVIKHNKKMEFATLCRWGRVGKVAGSTNKMTSIADEAKSDFKDKFHAKTGNNWKWYITGGFPFIKKKGKYDVVEIEYGQNRHDVNDAKVDVKAENEIPSKLDKRVQGAIKLMFDKSEWEASVKEMKFDVKKAPLGKLTKEQIKSGYESLKKIEACLKPGRTEERLEEACSEFYTRVPHEFGMKRPPLIRTLEEIKEKLQLLEALDDIHIAISLMFKEREKKNMNKLDYYYKSLQCELKPLESDDSDYKTVEKYVKNTHGSIHSYFTLEIEDIFQVSRAKDNKRFKQEIGNRMLLWHGSRLTNWCGILKEGFRIAPSEAPVTGYMFGKGVYFADMVSKAALYCYASSRQPVGFLYICEVALGQINEKTQSDHNANKLPKGKHSTKGVGMHAPHPKQDHMLEDGAIVPLGKPKKQNKPIHPWLNYNEFVVYNTAQIKPRFLVKVRFQCK